MLGIFLDLETTGLNANRHRTVEIAFTVVDLENGEIRASFDSVVWQPPHVWQQADPDSLLINGFTYERVLTGRPEEEIAREIIEIFEGLQIRRGQAVFICQNPSFDRMFFQQIIDVDEQERRNWPYHWLDFASMYWALHTKGAIHEVFTPEKEFSLSKNAIALRLGLPEESTPHRAIGGVEHLLACYKAAIGFPVLVRR